MGCNPSTLASKTLIPNMENRYRDARLPYPDVQNYKNDFEREFFMLVNMLRDNPNSFVPFIKQYALSPLCSNPKAAATVEGKLKVL